MCSPLFSFHDCWNLNKVSVCSLSPSLLYSHCQSANQLNECDEYVTAAVVYNIKSQQLETSLVCFPPPLTLRFSAHSFHFLVSSLLLLSSHIHSNSSLLVRYVFAPVHQGQDHVAEGGQRKAQRGRAGRRVLPSFPTSRSSYSSEHFDITAAQVQQVEATATPWHWQSEKMCQTWWARQRMVRCAYM